jgi:outer membrane protein TolC
MDWSARRKIESVLLLFLFCLAAGQAQQGDTLLSWYISQGLENNLALRQKDADYEKSLKALDEARSYFFPALSLNARYSLAEGGRTIYFPVGDMINPVYTTLNYLTQSNLFPTDIENQEFRFLRPHEQETKLELIQPLFNPDILYNYKIRKEMTLYHRADRDAYRRALVADIKKAYYTYLKMVQIDRLVASTRKVLEESVRLNEKLYENQKVTIDVVYRARSELSRFEQNAAEAGKNLRAARVYFNFLLNRPLGDTILTAAGEPPLPPSLPDAGRDRTLALQNREEVKQLQHGLQSLDYQLKLNRNNRLPTLFAALDYGIQGEKYAFDFDHDFTLASFVLRWDLFSGMQKKSRIEQTRLEIDRLTARREELDRQIQLQVDNAWHTLRAARKAMEAAADEEQAATKAFSVMSRKYEEGMARYVEFLDSRTNMTGARLRNIITRYDYMIALADYERVTATYLMK